MKRPAYSLPLLLIFAILSSCAEELAPNPTVAPSIPPAALFAIPTDLLTQVSLHDTEEATQSYWLHAGLHVFAWHATIQHHTQLPLAALDAASSVQPKRSRSGAYEWTFVFHGPEKQGTKHYEMNLKASYESDSQEIVWTLSEAGGREWLEGTTSRDASEGTFFVLPLDGSQNAVYRITFFQKEKSRQIRYAHLSSSRLEKERYVEHQIRSENEYDQAFEIQGSPTHSGNLLKVEWNSASKEGRVMDAAHFMDYAWHDWDERQIDIASM